MGIFEKVACLILSLSAISKNYNCVAKYLKSSKILHAIWQQWNPCDIFGRSPYSTVLEWPLKKRLWTGL